MKCPIPIHHNTDPFKEARETHGVLVNEFQGNAIPMILRHADVRKAAQDWQSYSSDAPFQVPIPTEEEVRTVRQLPLEVDPPEQTLYPKIAEPIFNRPRHPEVVARMESLADELVGKAVSGGPFAFMMSLPVRRQHPHQSSLSRTGIVRFRLMESGCFMIAIRRMDTGIYRFGICSGSAVFASENFHVRR